MYYLQSRYYNPEWGRFINADIIVGRVGDLLSHNMFAYSFNNPVNREDSNGFSSIKNFAKYTLVGTMLVAATVVAVGTCGVGGLALAGIGTIGIGTADGAAITAMATVGYVAVKKYISYAKPKQDKLRGRDAKRRERRQIDSALGKNRANRETLSRDLHNAKKGKRNDDNFGWDDLINGKFY